MSKENMKMNPGDVVIVSGVTEMVVVLDIGYNVPQGKNTSIPGDLALKSIDLWNLISCGRIFWHNAPTVRANQPTPKPTTAVESPRPVEPVVSNTPIQSELSKAQAESSRFQLELLKRIELLESENSKLKADSDRKASEEDKFELILKRLDNLPASVQVQGSTAEKGGLVEDSKVPIFVPSLPDARSIPGRIAPKTTQHDGSQVRKATKALKEFRSKGS